MSERRPSERQPFTLRVQHHEGGPWATINRFSNMTEAGHARASLRGSTFARAIYVGSQLFDYERAAAGWKSSK